ncbi:MAG: DUF4136 domain-containing protein [Desulfobacterales bacterium]
MPRYFWFIIVYLMIAFSACSTVRVSQDYRPEANFAGLATFRWHPEAGGKTIDRAPEDPLVSERIQTAVDYTLAAQGYRKAVGTRPDFYVDYRYHIRPVLESEGLGTEVGFGTWWGSGLFGGIGIGAGRDVYTRQQGVLYIDIIDPISNEIIWRGKGTHRVEEHWGPETKTEEISELVAKTLAQFPPQTRPAPAASLQ